MTQIKAKYQVKNDTGTYDEMMFETLGSQVIQDATHRFTTDTEKNNWNTKASTVAVTTTANGLMSFNDKVKLNGIDLGANNYVHPAKHLASDITQDASNRFVTDAEKTAWNTKASTVAVTTTANGLMSFNDKVKLNGIDLGANNYVHPAKHLASDITQDASNRFVTDAEKTIWNHGVKAYNSTAVGSVVAFRTLGIVTTGKSLVEWNCAVANKTNISYLYLEINTSTGAWNQAFSAGGAIMTSVRAQRINSSTWLIKWKVSASSGGNYESVFLVNVSEITGISIHCGGSGDTFTNCSAVTKMS